MNFSGSPEEYYRRRDASLWSVQQSSGDGPLISDGVWRFVDQGNLINTKSTDPFMGFECYASIATTKYLNLPSVRQAIHIPSSIQSNWTECNNQVHKAWVHQNIDMAPIFRQILQSNYPLKVLIYNGDLDSVCNFLMAEWFVENLAHEYGLYTMKNRTEWIYQQQPGLLENVAGFVKKYANQHTHIDLLTIKVRGREEELLLGRWPSSPSRQAGTITSFNVQLFIFKPKL